MKVMTLIPFVFFAITSSVAQDSAQLKIIIKGEQHLSQKYAVHEKLYSSSEAAVGIGNRIITDLWQEGYLAATIDSSIRSGIQLSIYLNTGKAFQWGIISRSPSDEAIYQQAGVRDLKLEGKKLRPSEISFISEKVLKYLENNGFPFASISLNHIEIKESEVTGSLLIDKGPFIIFDTLVVQGDVKISSVFVQNYLGIKPGGPYSELAVRNISKRIRELPFADESETFQVFFLRDKARILLHLKPRKSSRFDFLIGVLPNNVQKGGGLLITGEAKMKLVNPLGTGKSLFVDWKGLQPRSPQLKARFIYPYVFSSPIGIDAKFDLVKRDTLYLDIAEELGFQYLFSGNNYLKLFYKNKSTNLISVDTQRIIESGKLPSILDVSYSDYGIELNFESFDYHPNPRRGASFLISGSAGNKSVKRNSAITGIRDSLFDYNTLYDSIASSNLHVEIMYEASKYLAVGARSTIWLKARGALVHNDRLLKNELFRIGGYSTLRGFDEESIEASFYQLITAEYRFLLNQNSFFSLFWEGGYIVREVFAEQTTTTFPFGFGAGLAFNTKAGIFGINYAIGKLDEEPIQFKNAKIHFGYVGYF